MLENVDNIIFDLGGVVLDINISIAREELKKLGFREVDELFGLGHAASFFKDHEQGRISDDEFISEISKRMEGEVSDDQIREAWNSMLLQFPPKRIDVLHKLKKKYRLFLFSNTNGIHLDAFRKIYHSSFQGQVLDDLFEKAYYSHLMKLRKPDVQSFQFIIDDLGLDASRTLFIDDAEVNVEGAIKAGLQGMHLKPGTSIEDVFS